MIGTTVKANILTVGLSIEAIHEMFHCREDWLQQVFEVVSDKDYNNQSYPACGLADMRSQKVARQLEGNTKFCGWSNIPCYYPYLLFCPFLSPCYLQGRDGITYIATHCKTICDWH